MGNGGIQPSHGPVQDMCCTTEGGNTTLINADEGRDDDMYLAKMPNVASPLGEDDSHVQGIYREQNFAGS